MARISNTRKNTKVAKVEQAQKEEVMKTVKDLTPRTVATKVAELQAAVSGELANVQARITEQLTLLETVNQAITHKQQELKDLHGLADTALAQASLEDSINMTREQWTKEQNERRTAWEEEETQFQKERERTEQEWKYEFALEQKKRSQALEDELAARKRVFDTQLETTTKQLDARQQAIAAAEKELTEARTRIASFDVEVKKAADKEVAMREAAIKRQYEYESGKMQMQMQTEKQLAEQRVAAANNQVQQLMEQLKQAQATIDSQRSDLTRVSTQAFQSFAGQQALNAVTSLQRPEAAPTTSGKNAR